MMEANTNVISIQTESLQKKFKEHLSRDNNKRILFSGPFGTGKSTFLKDISENDIDDKFYFKIYPVNYSVAANDDVFELIKFDLLFHLIGHYSKEAKLQKEDFTLLLKSQMFIMERMNYMPLLYAILGFSEKIGTPVIDFVKAMEKTVGDYKKYSEDIKIDEEQDIHAFLKSIEQRKGTHHEMDAVSDLIFDLIQRIKSSKNGAQSVLIIDDLDRLDPEHIFRLFNIFSSHHDDINEGNKFGFDKVIFVCDIENIRKIFHHKYGAGVDFLGYIDKFYSIAPFDFDNKKYVNESVDNFINNLKFDDKLGPYSLEIDSNAYKITSFLMTSLIEFRLLNLRMLLNTSMIKIEKTLFPNNNGSFVYNTHNTPIIVIFNVLQQFFGSFQDLEQKMIQLYEILNSEKYSLVNRLSFQNGGELVSLIYSSCLPFLFDIKKYDVKDNIYCFSQKYKCYMHFEKPKGGDYNMIRFFTATKEVDIKSEIVLLNPYEILLDTLIECRKRGLLQSN